MKNSEDHIDNLFKENLENQSFDIPKDFMDDLNSRLDQMESSPRRRGGFWFFLFNGLFLFTFILLSFTQFSVVKTINTKDESSNIFTSTVLKDSSSQEIAMNTNNSNVSAELSKPNITGINASKLGDKQEDLYSASSSIGATQTGFEPLSKNLNKDIEKNLFNGNTKTQEGNSTKGDKDFSNKNEKSNPVPLDTIFIHDTLLIIDTLVVKDTVFIQDTNNQSTEAKWKLEVQMFAGMNTGSQQFSTVSTSGANYLLQESLLFTPSFGFGVNAVRNRVNLGSGIEYFQTGEKFSLNTSSVSQVDTIEIVGYDYDTVVFNQQTQTWDSVFVPVYDSVSYLDTITTSQNWVNAYSWISIPLTFGYRFDVGKWAIIPKAGITFNLGMRNDGKYLQVNGNDITIATLLPVRFNLDYLVQLELRRKFKKADIYASPMYRGNITPMFNGSSERKYQNFGMRLGVVIPL